MTAQSRADRMLSLRSLVTIAETKGISPLARMAATDAARKLWTSLANTPCDRHDLTGCGLCYPMPHTDHDTIPAQRTEQHKSRDRNGVTDGHTQPIVDSPTLVVHMTGWDTTRIERNRTVAGVAR